MSNKEIPLDEVAIQLIAINQEPTALYKILKFENLVACHLLKWCSFLQDTEGRDIELRYFRDVDKREVDFVIVEDGKPVRFVECKLSEKSLSRPLCYLKARFPSVQATQVSLENDMDLITKEGIRMCSAYLFLSDLV